jgi:hypothetical protein
MPEQGAPTMRIAWDAATPERAAPMPKPRRDETLVKALVRAHRWRRRIESGRAKSITDLAH